MSDMHEHWEEMRRLFRSACGWWHRTWVLEGASPAAKVAAAAAGIALVVLSLPRGRRAAEHYGSWDRFER